jgi:hypothetical protein
VLASYYIEGNEKDFEEGRKIIKYQKWKPNLDLEKWVDQLMEITPVYCQEEEQKWIIWVCNG